jgi:hypothetical protein
MRISSHVIGSEACIQPHSRVQHVAQYHAKAAGVNYDGGRDKRRGNQKPFDHRVANVLIVIERRFFGALPLRPRHL